MGACQCSSGHRRVRLDGLLSYPDLAIVVQLLALGFLVGCAVAPNLKTFTGQFILRWGHLWREFMIS